MANFMFGFVVGGLLIAWLAWVVQRSEAAEQCILDLLARGEPMYGLDLVEQSGGLLKRGTVYVVLDRMRQRGLVDATAPGPDGRRRYMRGNPL